MKQQMPNFRDKVDLNWSYYWGWPYVLRLFLTCWETWDYAKTKVKREKEVKN